ncbi:phosphatase PAP2 family protein [Caldimonas sp. KR1-144]|uniref:phosphatase PAP2 family protein n=1 Tax=Caldimonas sp. KR1-144 TaxID=3400911 RepID=UPI003C112D7B
MSRASYEATWSHCCELDLRWTLALQRHLANRAVVLSLAIVSRLGDGVLWYGLMIALPWLDRRDGWAVVAHMFALGVLNLMIYREVKRRTARRRPFIACVDVCARARVLDQFSFPSGHTLHAVAFATLLTVNYPPMAPALWAFAALVAASRVALGLHYPSDVLAGVALGLLTGGIVVAGS